MASQLAREAARGLGACARYLAVASLARVEFFFICACIGTKPHPAHARGGGKNPCLHARSLVLIYLSTTRR